MESVLDCYKIMRLVSTLCINVYYNFFVCRELDHAMLRRLEKRILVDLPTYEARKAMFKFHLPHIVCPKEGGLELLSNLDYDLLSTVHVLSLLLFPTLYLSFLGRFKSLQKLTFVYLIYNISV